MLYPKSHIPGTCLTPRTVKARPQRLHLQLEGQLHGALRERRGEQDSTSLIFMSPELALCACSLYHGAQQSLNEQLTILFADTHESSAAEAAAQLDLYYDHIPAPVRIREPSDSTDGAALGRQQSLVLSSGKRFIPRLPGFCPHQHLFAQPPTTPFKFQFPLHPSRRT